jgi:hypothetical protein
MSKLIRRTVEEAFVGRLCQTPDPMIRRFTEPRTTTAKGN